MAQQSDIVDGKATRDIKGGETIKISLEEYAKLRGIWAASDKVACNMRHVCTEGQCGARKPHDPVVCEPCPFNKKAKCEGRLRPERQRQKKFKISEVKLCR